MRIQHNIPAMSAYRNYTNNTNALAKNLEKLSSGYKINRAGDDAAGLAISEKMRAQISGLEQAQNNAKSGINLVQTAEGALTEVHDMLNRMYTLAEQSANGTYDDTVDRKQLQKELDQLRSEIDRIADSANFNGIKLLDGTQSGSATGMDRMIKTLATSDKGVPDIGTVTFLDGTGAGFDVNTEFEVDFNGLKVKGTGNAGGTTPTSGAQNVNVGDDNTPASFEMPATIAEGTLSIDSAHNFRFNNNLPNPASLGTVSGSGTTNSPWTIDLSAATKQEVLDFIASKCKGVTINGVMNANGTAATFDVTVGSNGMLKFTATANGPVQDANGNALTEATFKTAVDAAIKMPGSTGTPGTNNTTNDPHVDATLTAGTMVKASSVNFDLGETLRSDASKANVFMTALTSSGKTVTITVASGSKIKVTHTLGSQYAIKFGSTTLSATGTIAIGSDSGKIASGAKQLSLQIVAKGSNALGSGTVVGNLAVDFKASVGTFASGVTSTITLKPGTTPSSGSGGDQTGIGGIMALGGAGDVPRIVSTGNGSITGTLKATVTMGSATVALSFASAGVTASSLAPYAKTAGASTGEIMIVATGSTGAPGLALMIGSTVIARASNVSGTGSMGSVVFHSVNPGVQKDLIKAVFGSATFGKILAAASKGIGIGITYHAPDVTSTGSSGGVGSTATPSATAPTPKPVEIGSPTVGTASVAAEMPITLPKEMKIGDVIQVGDKFFKLTSAGSSSDAMLASIDPTIIVGGSGTKNSPYQLVVQNTTASAVGSALINSGVEVSFPNIYGSDGQLAKFTLAQDGTGVKLQATKTGDLYDKAGDKLTAETMKKAAEEGMASDNSTQPSTGTVAFGFKLGGDKGVNVTVRASAGAGAATIAANVFAELKDADSAASGVQVELNGAKWTVTDLGNGKLKFVLADDPTVENIRGNFDWDIDDIKNGEIDGRHTAGTVVTLAGAVKDTGLGANTVFEIKDSDITDGTKITLDGTTVTLAVGKDSAVEDGAGVVNLKHLEAGKLTADQLHDALSRISEAIGAQTTHFNVGVNDQSNGDALMGLTVSRRDGVPADYTTKAKLGAVFSLNKGDSGLTLQIGDTSDSYNQLKVNIKSIKASSLADMTEGTGMVLADLDISNQEDAAQAVKALKGMVNYVSDIRGELGATQNRLDHTINNLSVMQENIQDAESTIRDVDVAKEMMEYTKNSILVQSAQAMLAQANQLPQGVLQLLG